MRYGLRVAPRAADQIREAADWWLSNRPKAPRAFEEDLEKAFGLITSLPQAGQMVRHSRISGLRRAFMGRVLYYLYYRAETEKSARHRRRLPAGARCGLWGFSGEHRARAGG